MLKYNLIRYMINRFFLILVVLQFKRIILVLDWSVFQYYVCVYDSKDNYMDGYVVIVCLFTSYYMLLSYIYFFQFIEC